MGVSRDFVSRRQRCVRECYSYAAFLSVARFSWECGQFCITTTAGRLPTPTPPAVSGTRTARAPSAAEARQRDGGRSGREQLVKCSGVFARITNCKGNCPLRQEAIVPLIRQTDHLHLHIPPTNCQLSFNTWLFPRPPFFHPLVSICSSKRNYRQNKCPHVPTSYFDRAAVKSAIRTINRGVASAVTVNTCDAYTLFLSISVPQQSGFQFSRQLCV